MNAWSDSGMGTFPSASPDIVSQKKFQAFPFQIVTGHFQNFSKVRIINNNKSTGVQKFAIHVIQDKVSESKCCSLLLTSHESSHLTLLHNKTDWKA